MIPLRRYERPRDQEWAQQVASDRYGKQLLVPWHHRPALAGSMIITYKLYAQL